MDDMEVIVFEDLPSKKTPLDADNLNKIQQNAKKAIKNRKPVVELLTVSSTAPLECAIGDKYYNTTTSKIYTATATNTWATTGENPSNLYLYADLEHKELYYYDGTDFKSYGSGKKEIGYVGEEQEGTEVILIEDSDFAGENSVELAKVEQNLTSNSENAVPSVKAVNNGIKTNIVTGQEFATGRIIDGKKEFGKKFTYENISGVKNYDFDATNISEFTHMEGFCTTSTGGKYPLFSFNPYATGTGLEPVSSTLFCAWIEGSNLVVLAKKTTLTKATIYIYYTKNT